MEGGCPHPHFSFTKRCGEFPKAIPWAFDFWWVLLLTGPPVFPRMSNTVSALREYERNCLGSHTGPAGCGLPHCCPPLLHLCPTPVVLCFTSPMAEVSVGYRCGWPLEVKTVHTLTRGFALKQQMLPAAAVHCQVASSSEVMANTDLPLVTCCSGGCPSSGHGNNLVSSLRKVERMSVVWPASFFAPTIAHSVIHMYHPVPPNPSASSCSLAQLRGRPSPTAHKTMVMSKVGPQTAGRIFSKCKI